MNRILSYQPLHTSLAILLLRVIFGGLMGYHGYTKVASYEQIRPMFSDIIGIGAGLSFNLLIFAELVCASFVVIGFLTRLSVIPIFIAMVVAFFVAHGQDPFQVKELAFFFLTLSLVIFITGGGSFSVDRLLFTKKA